MAKIEAVVVEKDCEYEEVEILMKEELCEKVLKVKQINDRIFLMVLNLEENLRSVIYACCNEWKTDIGKIKTS